MKIISWNVNGIRAALNKGLADFLSTENPDILCLQETKAREEQVELPLEFGSYKSYWNSAEKPGYSGTAIFTKHAPLACIHGLGIEEHDKEGRVITLEYPDFHLVNVYTVNAQDGLRRLPYRLEWDTAFRKHLNTLAETKPVIFCGDLNVAHNEIDLARPKANRKSAGFSDEERASFSELLGSGFIDSFRHFHPDKNRGLLLVVLPRRCPPAKRRLETRLLRPLPPPSSTASEKPPSSRMSWAQITAQLRLF